MANRAARTLDRAAAAEAVGVSITSLDRLYADRDRTGFPDRVDGLGWDPTDLATWKAQHDKAKKDQLTTVDRGGNPDDLIRAPEVARVLGYKDRDSLSNSSVWPLLLERVAHEEHLPSGRMRREWLRSTVWEVADMRTGKGAPHSGLPIGGARRRSVDRSGDPAELVSAAEAARVLDYSRADKLPTALTSRADETTQRRGGQVRRYRRKTLWDFADQYQLDADEPTPG